MDSIHLTRNSDTLEGLRAMMEAADQAGELVQHHVSAATALLIVEIAKRAPDRPDWFPRGRWATLQEIEMRAWHELDKVWPRLHP